MVTVSFLVVAAVTALALRTFLLQRLDQQLAAAGDRFSLSLEHPDDHDADNSDQLSATQGQAVGTLGARMLNGTATAIAVIGHDEPAITGADRKIVAALQPNNDPRTIHLPGLGEYRVIASAGDDGDVLVTGLPEHPVDETITRLLLIEAAVFGACLLLTAVASSYGVRWSLRPLHRVATTALDVSNRPLSTGTVSLPERVAVPAPHTEAGQVADAFNHMLNHVEAALSDRHASEDRLRRFVADASHELRTPVAVIRAHAELAQRTADETVPDEILDALTRITSEADRMGHLVDDLLLLARLDSGRPLERSSVDITRLTLEAVADARLVGATHVWKLDLPEDEVQIEGDPRALRQVVTNLLTNARIHTPPGTTVTATITATSPSVISISVSDDGPGIPSELLPRIFDRFVRAELTRARPTGSGLGLSIVAAIVAAHHGSTDLKSRPGRTEVHVTLPRT
jgi:two-component system, OmpR family, sensor kinase